MIKDIKTLPMEDDAQRAGRQSLLERFTALFGRK